MSVLVMTRPIPPEALVKSLQARGFPHPVHTSLDDVDPGSVRWVITLGLRAGVFSRLPNLQMIFNPAAGVDRLLATPDLPAQVPISRTSDEAQSLELAQYVVHAALDHLRGGPMYRAQQARRDWSRHRRPVVGTTALVLGLGPIGQRIAVSLAALGFKVAGWSRTPRVIPGITCYAGAEGLQQALPLSRVLACALPLTEQTQGLIDASVMAQLPKGAIIINIGRGGQIVETDLIAALRSGHLGGASLDVQENEPMNASDPLWVAPNLQLTPHIAGQLSPDAVAAQFMEEVQRLERGEPLLRQVSAAAGY